MRYSMMAAAASALALAYAGAAQAASVSVILHGLRNSDGQVMVELCGEQSYLLYSCPGRRFVPAKAGDLVVRYDAIAPGKYAVTVFHDENSDGHLNFNSIGMPVEGWGASREPKILAGPPAFADTAVDVAEPQTQIEVQMHYASPGPAVPQAGAPR